MKLNTVPVQAVGINGRNKPGYLEILESAWQDHLKPKSPDAPTVISTFAGGGGSSLGYSMAGYRELLAVEWDDNAVATFKLNFPDVPVYGGDIAKLSVEECLNLAGIEPGELDLLDGSPPCQGFSTAGKRILDDPRNQLFREYVRLLRGLRPKVFVMENVSGMIKGKMKLVFAEIMRELKASGYKVSARLMNAMYFNVPQSRERMIFIGVREDLGILPSHPKGESRPVTVREALVNCHLKEMPPEVKWNDAMPARLRKLRPGETIGDYHGFGFDWQRLNIDKPFPTVPKSVCWAGYCLQFIGDLPLTGGQIRRAGSFPDNFDFPELDKPKRTYRNVVERIGNSVPPLMIKSIAHHIQQEILSKLTARDPIRLSTS